jgi:light-regulated signal transduction histidine kinase (bacteriophytochrome)
VTEPVQQIMRLARRAQAQKGGPTKELVQDVLECAERASNLLEKAIEHIKVTGRSTMPAPISLQACLDQALKNLRTSIDEAGADIHAAPLPMSVGDEYQIVHLFQNLVSNAIKFRGPEHPTLTITAEPRGRQWLLAFRDNGIGIPQGLTEQIFEIGRRLHTRDEYPGAGIGLALCRRIAERHGGRIWAESREGEGSTFFVLLPGAPADIGRTAGRPSPATLEDAL